MEVLEDIREMLYKELECMAQQDITKSNLEIIDKLTHSLKSIDTIIAMNEYDNNDNDYSRRNGMRYDGGYSYSGNMRGSRYGRSMGGNRGGSSYRGRYSREDSKEKMIEKLEDYMDAVESDKIRDSIQKVIYQIESDN